MPLVPGVLAALAVGLLAPLAASAQAAGGGSRVPCDVPLAWRIAGVDEGFGLSPLEAEEAVHAAAHLWEEAVGRTLFRHDPEGGMPVRFRFDARRHADAARSLGSEGLEAMNARIAEWRASLEGPRDEVRRARRELDERMDLLARRTEVHNRIVQNWNEQGGAPADVRQRLDSIASAYDAEARRLNERAAEIDLLADAYAAELAQFNQAVAEYNDAVARYAADPSRPRVEAGRYRERVTMEPGQVTSIEREIEVYYFAGHEHLVYVLAHELGHALGVGHVAAEGAVMAESTDLAQLRGAGVRVHERDLEGVRGCGR